MTQTGRGFLRRIRRGVYFYASYPPVLMRFRWREWRRQRELIPTRWLSSGELIRHDMEHLEGETATHFFSEDNLRQLSADRDSLNAKINTANRLIFTVFLVLTAQYVSIELDLSIFGISIKRAPGVTEALLCFMVLAQFLVSIIARTNYFIEATMKVVIDKITPPEIVTLVKSRYFPIEQFGPYQAFNLPHIIPNSFTRSLNLNAAILYFFIIIAPAVILFYTLHILLIYNMWSQPQLGVVSKFLSVYLFFVMGINFIYVLLIRVRMPYRDWSHNHVIELTEQLHPQHLSQRLDAAWGDISRERLELIKLGYLSPDGCVPETRRHRIVWVISATIVLAALLISG